MKFTTTSLATLYLGFASYTKINAQLNSQTVSSCQEHNPDNFAAAIYDGDIAVTYAYSLCFSFDVFGNTLESAFFCRDSHCTFYSDDACSTPAPFSVTPFPLPRANISPSELTFNLGWKSVKCGSSLVGYSVGEPLAIG